MPRWNGGVIGAANNPSAISAKGVWSLAEVTKAIRAGNWPVPTGNGDPYFQYNSMLLPGQGTNGAQNNTFLDSSTNNFTITRNGNTTQGTFTPFSQAAGYWSTYFDGSGDYLSVPWNATAFDFGTGNFTMEAWVCIPVLGDMAIWSTYDYQGGPGEFGAYFVVASTGAVAFGQFAGGSSQQNASSAAGVVKAGQWTHVAAVRNGNTLTMYANGVAVATNASFTYSVSFVSSQFVMANNDGVYSTPCFISNFRIVKGVAVYTGTFTPPTTPLAATQSSGTNISAITGTQTSLLIEQSNRFVDNSTYAATVTVGGNPQVTPFEPFGAPTSAYSASTVGGSGYFDGTGDYLASAGTINWSSNTNITINFWAYPTSLNGSGATVYGFLGTSHANADGYTLVYVYGDGKLGVGISGTNEIASAAGVIKANTWSYISIVRNGSTTTLYVNGTSVASNTTGVWSNNSATLWIGYTGGTYFTGYLSGLSVILGTATAPSGVPTEPPTNITNTNTLLNFTNAGIIDNAEKNDLETVGNAQISTSQYKWGTSSMYFDGTGDWLIVDGGSPNYIFGTGDFTIEMWINPSTVSPSYQGIWDSRTADPTVTPHITLASGAPVWWVSGAARITGPTLSASTWYHLAVSRTGGSTKMFVNGNQVGSTYADTNNYTSRSLPTIGVNFDGLYPFTGYLQDLRITKGYARYPYNFTAPTAALPLFYQAAATPSSDPYFEYTTLLLPGNGTNGAQNNTFLDSSTNAFTITRNGNTTQGTFTPFSQTGWSNYFDGTGDWLEASVSPISGYSGDLTIECWFYLTGTPSGTAYNTSYYILGAGTLNANAGLDFAIGSTEIWFNQNDYASRTLAGAYTAVPGVWNHVAVTRSGSSWTMWLNGVAIKTATSSTACATVSTASIGRCEPTGGEASGYMNGYISNLRIVKSAVYTAAFTPPTAALTAITNTSLLTCQSNRFIDNSSNAYTVTRYGDTSVQAFSPFNPTASYSTSTVGGSGYFDGSGDYLSVSNNALIATGDFTMEAWCYTTRNNAYQGVISSGDSSNTAGARIVQGNTGNVEFWVNGQANSSTALPINQWNHVAIVRSGSGSNNISCYLNGTRVAQLTQTSTTSNNTVVVGRYYNNGTDQYHWLGYISDARFVVGSAVYSGATYTVPTAPLTAITNTQLLLSGTNGGITDATAKNDLETVGGASISTTVSKFGGSSMYFDGSGDYLSVPHSALQNMAGGDITIECWVYVSAKSNCTFFAKGSGASNWEYFLGYDGTTLSLFYNGNTSVTMTDTISLNTWTHVAMSRYGSSLMVFINGVRAVNATYSGTTTYTNPLGVGAAIPLAGSGYVMNGYIQDFRITKGIARYTTNFTPPATAFLTL